jgi:hypothetical protein
MAQNNISGGAKQGLGAALVIDGQQFRAAWLPTAVSFTRSVLDVTHAQTTNFRASKADELADPLEVNGQFYFDMRLKALVELMTTAGVSQERDIYIMMPKTSAAQGIVEEAGYIRLPSGNIGLGTIGLDVGDTMKADFVVAGGNTNAEIEIQKVVSGNNPVSTSVAGVQLTSSAILADDIVATLSSVGVTHGPDIFFDLAGTDIADFYIDGKYIKAVADGGGGAGVKSLTVSVAGYTSWAEEISANYLTGEAVGFTLV